MKNLITDWWATKSCELLIRESAEEDRLVTSLNMRMDRFIIPLGGGVPLAGGVFTYKSPNADKRQSPLPLLISHIVFRSGEIGTCTCISKWENC